MKWLAVTLRGVGELLITSGLVVLLFVVYELYVTDLETARTQRSLEGQLRRGWAEPAPQGTLPPVKIGDGLAVLRIPKLGKGYDPVVVEGVNPADLRRGPGHYPGTALPGQVGNFVVSGHRTTYGKPFNRIDELEVGDPIVVETRTRWIVYEVTSKEVVRPSDVDVILPVPDKPGARPKDRLLTLTTCHPKYSAAQRLIVHAKETSSTKKSAPLPDALQGLV